MLRRLLFVAAVIILFLVVIGYNSSLSYTLFKGNCKEKKAKRFQIVVENDKEESSILAKDDINSTALHASSPATDSDKPLIRSEENKFERMEGNSSENDDDDHDICDESIEHPEFTAVFPQTPLSMKELELCNFKEQVIFKGMKYCKGDVTCESCSPPYLIERIEKIKNGFYRPDLIKKRQDVLNKVLKYYNQKSKISTKHAKERYPFVNMFATNYGQLYFLYNWACDLENRLGIDPRPFTIVIPTDKQAGKSLEDRGFNVLPYGWINSTYSIRKHYSGESELSTALLASKYFMIFTIIEYLEKNVTIFFQDVDVAWNKDPRPFLKEYSCEMDMVGMNDDRFDAQGFLNGGILYVKPTKKSQIFFKTWKNILTWDKDDQTMLNTLLRHRVFSEFKWKVAPSHIFQNRVPRTSTDKQKNEIMKQSVLIHAVSVPKEEQFIRVDRWQYTYQQCKKYFDSNIPSPGPK